MLLSVRNLRIDLATPNGVLRAVRGADLDVDAGQMLGIVGESGCGKSLTAMGILNLLPKSATRSADSIRFGDRELRNATESKMRELRGHEIGVIFQDPMTALNPTYTIGNQLAEVYIRHRRTSRRAADERSVYLLERVGITAAGRRLGQYPHQLSGGLRQRVVIAMALMCEPKLIVADEPTTALDVTIQVQILQLLKELQSELGAGVILITHNLGVIAQVADTVTVMYAGETVESGRCADVLVHPRHPYTTGLLACSPRADSGRMLGQIRGSVPSLMGSIHGCAFRNRCPEVTPECVSRIPVHHAGDHQWRCVHPAEASGP